MAKLTEKLRLCCTTFMPLRCFSAKPKVILDETITTLFSNEKLKYKNHPGIIKPRTPIFPDWALKEIKNILKEKHIVLKDIKESAKKLTCHLNGRHPPLEKDKLQERLLVVENRLNTNNSERRISIEDVDFLKDAKARILLKQHIYNWQPIKFDKLTCLTYLVARSVQNFAVLHRILNEIKERDKNFQPKTLFDFGSGVGTVMWVASELWKNSLKEYFCVETSESMIELSESLAKAAKLDITKIFYRQFFPASVNPTYDVIVSAYSLFELPNMQMRLETILKLWRKTECYLIIVEEGTNAGFKLVNEARDFVLKYANSKDRQHAHVFSPCPHDLRCPRLATDNAPCNFAVMYHPLQLMGSKQHKREFYSYVVLKKGKRPEDDEQWPRIVRDVLKPSRQTICRTCVASGELREEIFTKYKSGKFMYRCAKSSEWGDRLPVYYEQQKSSEEDDTSDGTTTVK